MAAFYNILDLQSWDPVVPTFSADTLAHATSYAQFQATMWNRNMALCPVGQATPASGTASLYTVVTPGTTPAAPSTVNVTF